MLPKALASGGGVKGRGFDKNKHERGVIDDAWNGARVRIPCAVGRRQSHAPSNCVGATDWASGWAGDMATGMAEQAIPLLEEYINNVS